MAVPIQQQEMVQYSQRFYLTHFSTMSLRNIYEKIRDVEIDFLNHLGSVFNPNYIAALPNSPNIINHPVIHFHVPTKIFLSPSFSRYSTPPQKKKQTKNLPSSPPPFNPPQPSTPSMDLRHLGGGCASVTCEGCESFGTSSSCTYPGVC